MTEIPLTQGKTAIVDDADVERLRGYSWHARRDRNTWYAAATLRGADGTFTTVLMHRLIACTPNGMDTDHRNLDGLDNRRSNLRICTGSQNHANRRVKFHSSRFKGVDWVPSFGKWRAQIKVAGKKRHLGLFADEIEASRAYDAAAKASFGDFARTNVA